MIVAKNYISSCDTLLKELEEKSVWAIPPLLISFIEQQLKILNDDYVIRNGIAIHKLAHIEEHVVLKPPLIIHAHCFIAAHAYLRAGVIAGENVVIGPGCEIKSSVLFPSSSFAHFNFVGDSVIGSGVNMEAGSVIANHYNERSDKIIYVKTPGGKISTGVTKFGALVGDGCKIGANAVLSPGTVLPPSSIVKRLELIGPCAD